MQGMDSSVSSNIPFIAVSVAGLHSPMMERGAWSINRVPHLAPEQKDAAA